MCSLYPGGEEGSFKSNAYFTSTFGNCKEHYSLAVREVSRSKQKGSPAG